FLEDFLNVKSFECDESELRKNLSYRYDGDLVKSNSFILHKELPSLGLSAGDLKRWIATQASK
ncbi:MAG: hypothetical protein AB8C84_00360, partial [Oligoflexales bacterium]